MVNSASPDGRDEVAYPPCEPSSSRIRHFLKLPAEVRNIIYEDLVDFAGSTFACEGKVAFGLCPTIARVCKQIHGECMPMYLSTTDFVDSEKDDNPAPDSEAHRMLIKGLERLGPALVHHVKSITIEIHKFSWIGRTWGAENLVSHWETLIPRLIQLGVVAHQLKWPGMVSGQYDHSRTAIMRATIMYHGVILYALNHHDYRSPQSPIPLMYDEITDLEFYNSDPTRREESFQFWFRDPVADGLRRVCRARKYLDGNRHALSRIADLLGGDNHQIVDHAVQ